MTKIGDNQAEKLKNSSKTSRLDSKATAAIVHTIYNNN
jgi:hypothetical protein